MNPYSQDLREKIIQAPDAREETQSEVAGRFAVSLSFVEKLWHQWQTTSGCTAKPYARGQKRRLRDHAEKWRSAVANQPDATLERLSVQIVQVKRPQGSLVNTGRRSARAKSRS
jgi:transposase